MEIQQYSPKFNKIFTLGKAVVETCKFYYDYCKTLECCSTEAQKNEALSEFFKQLKALGDRKFCSPDRTTGAIKLGAAIGSYFPAVGTLVGGIIGAIIGAICSYFIDKNIIDPTFLVQNNDLIEYERQVGLQDFKSINNGQDYSKKEFYYKYKTYLLNEHPDKQISESLKAIARQKIQKIQQAKQIIYKQRGWRQ
ncbi:hypothetical protein ABPG72_016290 [Tetrahymena utriculariae]